jgi:hypothetical protein
MYCYCTNRYGAALALHDIDQERKRISEEAGDFTVLVVGEGEEHSSLSSALRKAAKSPQMQRTLVYLKGELFEEVETLELAGQVLVQPDASDASVRPVIRVSGPHAGLKCVTASAAVTFANVRLELDTPFRKPLRSVQVNTKPLVHPASNSHTSLATGFATGCGDAPSRCFDVSMGQVTLKDCLVVNLTGIHVCDTCMHTHLCLHTARRNDLLAGPAPAPSRRWDCSIKPRPLCYAGHACQGRGAARPPGRL